MRSIAAAAIVIAAGFGPTAHAGQWMTDPRSACAIWDPQPVPDETVGWMGGCTDGKASGSGVLTTFRLGRPVERDDGAFVDGRQTGHGVRQYLTGRYEGSFANGLFDGKGIYLGTDGTRYEGEWKDGNFDGHGTLSFASGLRYEGEFRANAFNGFGSLSLPDGTRYDGEYVLNTPHGTGVYRTADGSIFAGQWTHGCFNDGRRAAYLAVPAEDCGLPDESSAAMATARDNREN
jgi:hypothetical protein